MKCRSHSCQNQVILLFDGIFKIVGDIYLFKISNSSSSVCTETYLSSFFPKNSIKVTMNLIPTGGREQAGIMEGMPTDFWKMRRG